MTAPPDLFAPLQQLGLQPHSPEAPPPLPMDGLDPSAQAAMQGAITGIDAIRATAGAPISDERDTIQTEPDSTGADMMSSELGLPQVTPELKMALTTLYGSDFPLLGDSPDEEDWVTWAHNTWDRLGPGVQRRLHLVQRNRMYRQGMQWISSSGYGPWRAPARNRDEVRVVENVIAPALNQRIQILTEQRPGFRVRPATGDQDDMKRAEAKQVALEYQFDQQGMLDVIREAAYWAGTDGVTFLELYWDPDAGPWHEGYADPKPPTPQPGAPQPPPQPQQSPPRAPLGDVKSRVRRIEQVRVSANSTASRAPWFWIVRDVMSKAEAVRVYGAEVGADNMDGPDTTENLFNSLPMLRMGYQLPTQDELLLEQEKVNRYTIYCEKSIGLPKGLTLLVVGEKLVFQGPLLCGTCPMVRWTDGSTDPSFYCTPDMDLWIDSQVRINQVKSKYVENIRLNSGPKLLAKENSIAPETYTAANMSVISAKGLGNLSEIVKPIDGFSIGEDAKELLQLERKQFEDLTGWNDTSRGSFGSDPQSGRAILAIREQLERAFTPMVNAASKAMTDWGRISCSWMAWGYDIPRDLGVEGKSRPDLTRALTTDDFDGVTDIWIDPETLMPMPRALRLFLLKDMFQQGMMSAQEYRRRLPFAWVKNINSPDEDQDAAARRLCEYLRQGIPGMQLFQMSPERWVWDESIIQDALQRELLLPGDVPPPLKNEAWQLWAMLAQQAQMKQGIMPPGGGGSPGQGKPKGKSSGLSAVEQPFAGSNPGVAAQQTGMSDQDRAAHQFEAQQKVLDQSH